MPAFILFGLKSTFWAEAIYHRNADCVYILPESIQRASTQPLSFYGDIVVPNKLILADSQHRKGILRVSKGGGGSEAGEDDYQQG
jgi:hypothetical protein